MKNPENTHDPKPTKRELEILKELATGLTSKEVAAKLCLSVRTVEKHRENIYVKLNVKNGCAAMNKAKDLKWL